MLTEFGKMLRKIRIDRNQLLRDMSSVLGVTASYLSAVEHGKREIPSSWKSKIVEYYSLNSSYVYELDKAIDNSKTYIKLDLVGANKNMNQLANAFARRFDNSDLEENEINKMIDILTKKGGN